MIPHKMSFVIVGGGTAGWLSALALSYYGKISGREYKTTVIEPSDLPTVGVGEATTDSLIPFLESLGIDIENLIKEVGASFKQTILLKDWYRVGEDYWHPFYEKSLPLSFLLDAQSSSVNMGDLFLNVILAKKVKRLIRQTTELLVVCTLIIFFSQNTSKKLLKAKELLTLESF